MGEGLFQPLHILLIVAIALLVFGTSKFSALGKGLGEGIRNFKSAMKEGEEPKKEEKIKEKEEKEEEKKS
jgi:sec-independent protein translocase protein TatA